MCEGPIKDNGLSEVVSMAVADGASSILVQYQEKDKPFVFTGRHLTLQSVPSIVEFVKRKGSVCNTVIFYDDAAIRIVLDDAVTIRKQDTAEMKFNTSYEWKEWGAVIGRALSQRDFIDFLSLRESAELDIFNPEKFKDSLLAKLQNLRVATKIVGDFQYTDNNNIAVAMEIKDMETSVQLPRYFTLNIPILKNFDMKYVLELELTLYKPKEENQKPTFELRCLNFDKVYREAVEDQIKVLRDELPEHMILAGYPDQQR